MEKIKYVLRCDLAEGGQIIATAEVHMKEKRLRIQQRMMDTQDQMIAFHLIKLGWIPPSNYQMSDWLKEQVAALNIDTKKIILP